MSLGRILAVLAAFGRFRLLPSARVWRKAPLPCQRAVTCVETAEAVSRARSPRREACVPGATLSGSSRPTRRRARGHTACFGSGMSDAQPAPFRRDQRAVLSFPPFRLDISEARLWKDGRELRLRPKPFAILCCLTQHPRKLVTRSEIVDAVWGRMAMSESLVRTHVRDLRLVLGEHLIETVVGRGYRFMADVRELHDAPRGKGVAEKAPPELVRTSESPSRGQSGEVGQVLRAADSARMLKELTDALTRLGTRATVLLLVGDEHVRHIATLLSPGPPTPPPIPAAAVAR
jgi:DNA-binding winged helix-turn-helix (wHTH) protein